YWTEGLRWESRQTPTNPDGYEGIAGAPVLLFPDGRALRESTAIDYEDYDDERLDPLLVHLAGAKENRLLSYRLLAYDYQRQRPGCGMEEYVLRHAAAPALRPRQVHEKLACEWLNSWGDSQPLDPSMGRMPALLAALRPAVVCQRRDGYIVARD